MPKKYIPHNALVVSNIWYWIVAYIWRIHIVGWLALPMLSLAIASTWYHLFHEKKFWRIDMITAYSVIAVNVYLYIQSYNSILSALWAILAMGSLFVFVHQWEINQSKYVLHHSIRHLCSALATLLIYIGYSNFH